ncbi:HAD family hydrolase [Sorangium sp. So ce385]|uniref:HAD family hydrolase n=1 Tax=Sorangium sp. So ce385 TaxID=3133308 RepID=UPI003F5B8FDB
MSARVPAATDPVKAVIFDHDGVLVNTVAADFLACSALFAEHGTVLPATLWAREVCGHADGYSRLFDILLASAGHGHTPERLRERLTELWDRHFVPEHVSLMPGVRELLAQLRDAGTALAVASSSDAGWVRRWLLYYDLERYFDAVVTGDQVRRRKPDPAVHLAAAAALGVAPCHCVVVEDSLTGVAAARAAGMRVIAVPTELTRMCDYSAADQVLPGLTDVDPARLLLAPPDSRPPRAHTARRTAPDTEGP